MACVGIVSYRLLGTDGVSIEAEKWAWALGELGAEVRRIAGAGPAGVQLVGGLGMAPEGAVDLDALDAALEPCDLVIVENLCSLPLNPAAGAAVAERLHGRPAIMRHHDLAWHRDDTSMMGPPPDDPGWRHVTISKMAAAELKEHDIDATVIYNRFDLDPPQGARDETRSAMGIGCADRLLLQPTRALRRKNVPGGLALAEALGAAYWLTAPAEDGYGDELADVLAAARVPVLRGQGPGSMHDVYAASDAVVLPSSWEGFGNPVVESIAQRRPLALGNYPVASEIRAMGFAFFDPLEPAGLESFLSSPDQSLLEENRVLAGAHFDIATLPAAIDDLLTSLSISERDDQ